MSELLPVGSFVRVSSLGQVEAESPETHIEGAEYHAEQHGLQIVSWYRLDSVPGKESLSHAETKKMKAEAKAGKIKGVLFTSLTRLGRDMVGLVLIERELREKYGVKLISIQEEIDTSTAAGLERFYALAARAEIEIKVLSERVRRGNAMRRRRGEVLGKPSFGYRKVGKQLEIDPIEGPIRASMFALYLRERRIKTVAAILNEEGHRTRLGKRWSSAAVRRLLRDTAAKGVYLCNRYGGKGRIEKDRSQWVSLPCPALVSAEIFDRVQAIMDQNECNQPTRKPKSPYSNLLVCECGTRMRYKKGNSVGLLPNYHCPECKNRIRYAHLDQAIGQVLKGFVFDNLPDAAQYETSIDSRWQQAQSLEALIAEVKGERDRLISLYTRSSSLSEADFDTRHQPLVDRQAELEASLKQLREALSAETDAREDSDRAAEVLLRLTWGEILPQEKGEILRAFVKRIVLTNTTIEFWPRALPSRVILADDLPLRGASPGAEHPYSKVLKITVSRPDPELWGKWRRVQSSHANPASP